VGKGYAKIQREFFGEKLYEDLNQKPAPLSAEDYGKARELLLSDPIYKLLVTTLHLKPRKSL
jgi:hypothetical protein